MADLTGVTVSGLAGLGYHLISSSTYIDLSKKPYEPLSLRVVPISEKLASGPWTIRDNSNLVLHVIINNFGKCFFPSLW